ncbi:CBS domain-containing protein [Streptomyces chattanoogensis]|uniref:Inosine-5'-monophosphate dehydrogenase n=1 Tax=Streptomyces chattanoogensis TaxID=66876 RepID=A0A0N1JYM6_9ACTN|nr:CBS domain-containing protein [Streptomyces chattanoogensis]KPC64338.1 inosine-5'-monophosphate dehydrogenase [Streptomyces chattanoogensis]
MQHRTVGELMTRDVVHVRPDMPFKEIVKTLADNDVTAVLMPIPPLEAWERAKAEGARAEELMSAPAVCARRDWHVVEAARLMEVQNVKRLPVVDETDKLVGIVSRRDLLRVFLRRDDAIREEIRRDVLDRTLGLAPSGVTVEVRQGQVRLGGSVQLKSLIPIIERLCRSVDGVVSVTEHLAYETDDTHSDGTRTGTSER